MGTLAAISSIRPRMRCRHFFWNKVLVFESHCLSAILGPVGNKHRSKSHPAPPNPLKVEPVTKRPQSICVWSSWYSPFHRSIFFSSSLRSCWLRWKCAAMSLSSCSHSREPEVTPPRSRRAEHSLPTEKK